MWLLSVCGWCVAQGRVRALLSSTREGKRSTRLVLKGMFGRVPQATACLQAGCRTFGQLERCSSACQSVAQIDQRDAAAKNGKRHVCSEHIVFPGLFDAVIRQRVGQASG